MGVPRVVQDGRTGLLADPDVAGSYQAALRQMIEDTGLRARLGAGARVFVDGERSGDAAAAHLKRVIDAVHLKTGR
jgi:glycosyltransferase involved in cell wall biosynthesis